MEEAEYCHRLALMYKGRVIALGTPEELKKEANQPSMEEVFIHVIEEEDRKAA